VFAFILGIATIVGYLYANAGGYVPGFSKTRHYQLAFDVPSLANVVPFADVYIAGVPVGKIDAIDRISNDSMRITMKLDDIASPAHAGTTAQISEKALTGQPMVRLVPGTGPELPSGSVLPATDVKPTVQLRDVLASLDKPTLNSLGSVIRSVSQGTDGRQKDVSGIFEGLADIGNNGNTALDALANQSVQLQQVSNELSQVMDAFDAGQGQIAQLVSSADRLTAATAGQRQAVEDSMRKLPGTLDSATAASDDITRLSAALRPVAADLRTAAPDLNAGLDDLPSAGHDLRGSLGPLDNVLTDASPTFHKVPDFKDETHDFVPQATSILRDLNPMLRYIEPYNREIVAFFTTFDGTLHHFEPDGQNMVRLKPYGDARTIRPNPLHMPEGIFMKNPYPEPGSLDKPMRPFTGQFPRIHRDD
jgi:phospholipid/cholesterol/gamma-HCH transport system substrate-binding protein